MNLKFSHHLIMLLIMLFLPAIAVGVEYNYDSWDVEIIEKNTNQIVRAETVASNFYSLEGLERNKEYFAKVRTRNTFLSAWEISDSFMLTSSTGLISSPKNKLLIQQRDGVLLVSSDDIERINIYTLNGSLLQSAVLIDGKTEVRGLTRGVYIINNQKIVIE